MVGLLSEAEYQEQDRRRWLLAQKFNDPVEAYGDMRERVEQSINAALEPDIDEREDLTDAQKAWYRA